MSNDNSTYIFNNNDLTLNDISEIIDFNFQIELSEIIKENILSNRAFL